MTTCTIQIGNSDNKLTQSEWRNFVLAAERWIGVYSSAIHFSGFSRPDAAWQNACWVAEVSEEKIRRLEIQLAIICVEFKQDSIALTVGRTVFVK